MSDHSNLEPVYQMMNDQIARLNKQVFKLEKAAFVADVTMLCLIQYLADSQVIDYESLRAYLEESIEKFGNADDSNLPEVQAQWAEIVNKIRSVIPRGDKPK